MKSPPATSSTTSTSASLCGQRAASQGPAFLPAPSPGCASPPALGTSLLPKGLVRCALTSSSSLKINEKNKMKRMAEDLVIV